MDWKERAATFAAGLVPEGLREAPWLRPNWPLVALELRDDALVAVRLKRERSGFVLAGHARRALPPGAFAASLLQPGAVDREAFQRAVADVLRMAGAGGGGRISLALPDAAVRVTVLDFPEFPAVPSQADAMVRHRIRKSVPFRPEETRVSWQTVSRRLDGGARVVACVTADALVAPLEDALAAMGLRCGLVDVASLDLLNALRLVPGLVPAGDGVRPLDVALVNATPGYLSVMVLRDGEPVFVRCRAHATDGRFEGAETLAAVAADLRLTLGHYEEHLLGGGIETTWLRAVGVPGAAFGAVLAEAGFGGVRELGADDLPLAAGLRDDEAAELLPAIGLALRRAA